MIIIPPNDQCLLHRDFVTTEEGITSDALRPTHVTPKGSPDTTPGGGDGNV